MRRDELEQLIGKEAAEKLMKRWGGFKEVIPKHRITKKEAIVILWSNGCTIEQVMERTGASRSWVRFVISSMKN
jgi:hypothetical protein